MAFPATPLGAAVELGLSADLTASPSSWSWSDYTDYVHGPSKVSTRHGRTDRYSTAAADSCSLTFLNNDGRFVPTNPRGVLYGQIDLNTPIRVLIRPDTNLVTDSFTRSVSNGWGTSSSGAVWTATGTAANFSVTGTVGRHTHSAATGALYATLPNTMLRSDITVKVKVNALSTGAPQTVACVSRFVDGSNVNRCELRFMTDASMQLRLVHRIAATDTLGVTAATGLTHVAANSYWLRVQVGKTTVRAKAWLDGTTQPRTWQLDGSAGVDSANAAAGKPGVYSIRETGNTNASATLDFDEFTLLDGVRIRYTGFVDEWPTEWVDSSEGECRAPITASGQLRRTADAEDQSSALYRAHTLDYRNADPQVTAYWSLEDKTKATTFASALNGGAPMIYSNFTPASDSTFDGSESLPVAGTGAGTFSGAVRSYTSPSPNEWTVRAAFKFPTAASVNSVLVQWNTAGGSMWRWQLVIITGTPDTFKLQAFDSAGSEKLAATAVNFTDTLGVELYGASRNLYLRADATQNAGNIDWAFGLSFIDANGLPTTKVGAGSVAGTLGNVSRIFGQLPAGFGAGGYTVGHIAAGKSTLFGPSDSDAITGYAGEDTGARFLRMCAEQGFAGLFGDLVVGGAATDQLMGVQGTSSVPNQLREIEATEEGILFDGMQGQVQLLPRSLRRNHTVDMTLDISDLAMPLNATYDSLLFRNDVKVSSPTGSTVRRTATGDASPAKLGTATDTVTANVFDDTDLDAHAEFRLAMGSLREGRLPLITLNLVGAPNQIESWLNVDVGSKITIANLPDQLDPTPLELLVEGWTEEYDAYDWTARINCSSATVWNAFTLQATGNQGRLDTHGSYLLSGYTSGATTLSIGVRASPYGLSDAIGWSTTAEPYDLSSSGERLTCTAMNTVVAALISSGTAAHADAASVTPPLPASIVNGDLLLILAAVRDTADTVNDLPDWEVLADAGNVRLFARHWDGVFTAPTVTFTGAVAGDTCSAQMGALRGVQNVVTGASVIQTNGVVQNIDVASIAMPRDRSMVITCGWKQIDWTSVATLGANNEIGDSPTAVGNNQGIVWDSRLFTTAQTQGTVTFAVTGGTTAISKGFAVALACDVYAATVTRSVNGVVKALPGGSEVTLWKAGRVAL
jgi:hypothetical protein